MQKIMGYEVVRKIGEGGYGTVYLVRKENAAGTFLRALKHISYPSQTQLEEMKAVFSDSPQRMEAYFKEQLEKMLNEIRIQDRLGEEGNGHIVRCFDSEVRRDAQTLHYDIYILMEYLTPLRQYIQEHSLSETTIVQLGIQILDAVALCHRHDIVHRDIKEDNIFVSDNGVFKLGDFGIAKQETNTSSLSWKMTMNYSSPEVLTQQSHFTAADDIYSMGVVLYKLLNHGRFPYLPPYPAVYDEDDKAQAMQARIRYDSLPLPDDCGERLGKIVLKALVRREQRYPSADAFKAELERYLESEPASMDKKDLGSYVNQPDDHKTGELSFRRHGPSGEQGAKEKSADLFEIPKKAEELPEEDLSLAFSAQRRAYEAPPAEKTSKNNMTVFLLPAVFLVLLLIIVLFVVPAVLHTGGSYLAYLFESYDSLSFMGDIVPAYQTVILFKVLTVVFFVLFIGSLFYAGRSLNRPRTDRAKIVHVDLYDRLASLYDLSRLQACYRESDIQELFEQLIEKTRLNQESGNGSEEQEAIELDILGSMKRLDERLRERDQQAEVRKELLFIRRKLAQRERASHHRKQ